MKKVTIIYRNQNNPNAVEFIKQNLEEIFGSYITFDNCFLSKLNDNEILNADAFIALNGDVFQKIKAKGCVEDFHKIIKMNRSASRDALGKITKIPSGTKVLVVNDSYESSVDTVQSLYEAGINHISMIPFDEELANTTIYQDIQVAVTPSEQHLIPAHIKNIIDIGYRKVSFDTMFKLMKLLDLDIASINRNLFRHIHSIIESSSAFHDNYIFGYLKGEILSHIVSTSKVGMLLVNMHYEIVYTNDKARQILKYKNISSNNLKDYIDHTILFSQNSSNRLIRIGDDNYYYDKYTIPIMDETAGYYITLQNENDVNPANKALRQKGFTAKHQFKDIIYASPDMEQVLQTARRIAQTDHTVLIRGESGTGKELFAQSLHNASHRSKKPFVAVNCAALPDNLLESELFGYEPGAFTGAHSKGKVGLFEEANHGTIFLDEIGDISPKLQSRLLRALQERQIMRIGSDRLINIDFRLIAATNKKLEDAVREGSFRSDLFFRLNVLPISIPPLRRRKEDLPLLLQHFLGSRYKEITPEQMKILLSYDWPGNIRELKNFSIYYETLSDLPEYILHANPGSTLPLETDRVNVVILNCISENTGISSGIGRSSLLHLLQNKGIRISDGKLRSMLSQLEQDGLIHVGKGRCGTLITEKGFALLKDSSKI
ncbi:MAG: sigma 54-interacting transcriptional regulator [Emergencia sp.]|nr:sigma 54-interacting transcriptional regulator [Emergencia sp.]